MKYTFACRPGRFGVPGLHIVVLGGWYHGKDWVVLHHGTMNYCEWKRVERCGYIPIYSEGVNNIIRIWQDLPDRHASAYRWKNIQPVAVLRKNRDNIYIGKVDVKALI